MTSASRPGGTGMISVQELWLAKAGPPPPAPPPLANVVLPVPRSLRTTVTMFRHSHNGASSGKPAAPAPAVRDVGLDIWIQGDPVAKKRIPRIGHRDPRGSGCKKTDQSNIPGSDIRIPGDPVAKKWIPSCDPEISILTRHFDCPSHQAIGQIKIHCS